MSARRAFITGISGQDGSYLAELLLDHGYEVHGLIRRSHVAAQGNLRHLVSDPSLLGRRLFLHSADLAETTHLRRILNRIEPQELYHLAGQSHVGLSFDIPESTCELTAMGTLRLLEIVRDLSSPPRVFHASSSEVFGRPTTTPQTEQTPFRPVTPYGCAKAFATQMVDVYRRSFGLFGCNGILYNHESPRRGEGFVTRKICRGAASIRRGLQQELVVGDCGAQRDWGDAREYVRGMWLALQHSEPNDYVFATGQLHRVQEIIEIAFATVGLDWRAYVRQDTALVRPGEPQSLVGDASRAADRLGWRASTPFEELIREMTRAEMQPSAEDIGAASTGGR